MKLIHVLILFALCVFVGTYIYFFELRTPPQAETGENPQTPITKLSKDELEKCSFTFSDGREVVLVRKESEKFAMEVPFAARADYELIDRILATLSELKATRTVKLDPSAGKDDASRFGFDHPRAIVKLWQKQKTVPVTLYFGKTNPVNFSVYLKLEAEPTVYTVGDYVLKSFELKNGDFREHSLLPRRMGLPKKLIISRGEAILELSREGDSWSMTRPWGFRISAFEAGSLCDKLKGIRIEQFADDQDSELIPELMKPSATASLWWDGRVEPETIIIGDVVPAQKLRFAKFGDDLKPVLITGESIDSLIVDPVSLFEKRLLISSSLDVTKLLLKKGDLLFKAERDKDNRWHKIGPAEGETHPIKDNSPQEFLQSLVAIEAKKILPQQDPPAEEAVQLLVELTTSADKREIIQFTRGSLEDQTILVKPGVSRPMIAIAQADLDRITEKASPFLTPGKTATIPAN